MRSISIGQHAIPLWLVVTLVLSGVFGTVLANHIWTSLIIDLEVEEPLKILHYPKKLSLYAGETKEFNVTIKNSASRNYTVVLDFSLDNSTYQESFVTFSNETYTVVPNKQNLTAWLQVEEYAPPIETSLTIAFHRIAEGEGEVLFFDDFDDGVADGWTVQSGTWEVVGGEYYSDDPVLEPNPDGVITTVDELELSDFIITVDFRIGTEEAGFRQGLVFRYADSYHYYRAGVSDEYDCAGMSKFTPEDHWHGEPINGTEYYTIPINPETTYSLKLIVSGNNFSLYLDGDLILTGSDTEYTTGLVGLKVQGSDCYFDNFTVYSLP